MSSRHCEAHIITSLLTALGRFVQNERVRRQCTGLAGSRLATSNGVSSQWAAQLLAFHLNGPVFPLKREKQGFHQLRQVKGPKEKSHWGRYERKLLNNTRKNILMTGRLAPHPTQTKVQKMAGVGGKERE